MLLNWDHDLSVFLNANDHAIRLVTKGNIAKLHGTNILKCALCQTMRLG